jgi:hypothetical protein
MGIAGHEREGKRHFLSTDHLNTKSTAQRVTEQDLPLLENIDWLVAPPRENAQCR